MPLINLNSKIANDKKSGFKKTILVFIVILLLLFVFIYLPARGIFQSIKQISASVKTIQIAANNQNLDQIRSELDQIKNANQKLNSSIKMLIWLKAIPVVGEYYSDISRFSQASIYELDAIKTLSDKLDPYKNELGFTNSPNPSIDRMSQAVRILNKIVPVLPEVEDDFKNAAKEIENINTDKYPEKFGRYVLRARVEAIKNLILTSSWAITEAKPAIEVAPKLLGEPTPKTYLLLFQNDKEIRPTGGFLTAFATISLNKGKLSASTSDDIYKLDEKLLESCKRKICPLTPPEPIVKYLPEESGKPRSAWSLRDSNISPDVPTSMKTFEKMYGYIGEGFPFDGIILIDTKVVEELIKITGPVEVFSTKYSAEIDGRCECPNVIFELQQYSQIIEKGDPDRKAILGTLMQQILAKALSVSEEQIPNLINAGIELADTKHIIYYMHDENAQKALSNLNWTGEIKDSNADYININDTNFAGRKTNLYVEKEVSLEIDEKSGNHKLIINYKNPFNYSTWLNGINRNYLRVYIPKGSKLISSKGSEVKVSTIEDELGKTVFEAFLQVRPQNSTKIYFEYETPKIQNSENKYKLLIQKQPGAKDYNFEVNIKGKSLKKYLITSDLNLAL